jgi:hypothetical protein
LSSLPSSANGFASPQAILPRSERFAAGKIFTMLLPAQSVSVITLRVGP